MNRFHILLLGILIFSFFLHLFAIKNNNFYFTVDQGRDAVYVREIVNYQEIFLKGPETTIRGVFTGPLWYYFLAVGYFIFGGNPIGGVFMMIILNLLATAILMIWIKRKVNARTALVTGFLLQIFWPFFLTSSWAFNPFPLVSLFIFEILIIISVLENKTKFYLGLIPIFLALNTHLAGAVIMILLYLTVMLWKFQAKILKKSVVFAFFDGRIFGGLNYSTILFPFISIIGVTTLPQNTILGALIFLVIFLICLKRKGTNPYTQKFIYLSILTLVISYLFFGSNRGWRDWHTVYLSPLLFISLIFMISSLNKKVNFVLITILGIIQIINFKNNYLNILKPTDDPGILANQLKVLDWIYTHNEENGFSAYVYTNTFYDYNYQYLFSWYGAGKYKFYPCEYSNFPLSHKILYVPGFEHYVEPKLGCDKLRFLIIESDTNGEENKDWINKFRSELKLVESVKIGPVTVEKLEKPPQR